MILDFFSIYYGLEYYYGLDGLNNRLEITSRVQWRSNPLIQNTDISSTLMKSIIDF